MTYEVKFTRWRAVTLGLGVFFLAVLLFFSGVLVGLGLWRPTMEELALAREYRQRELAAKQGAVKPPAPTVVAAAPPEHAAPAQEPSHDTPAPATVAPAVLTVPTVPAGHENTAPPPASPAPPPPLSAPVH